MAEHGFRFNRRLRNRVAVFDLVASRVQDKKVLYLEFGVYKGASIRYWSQKLRHPEAKLHGFDSFEGLPEDWEQYRKGHFDLRGHIPDIDDPRVRFFKGWFNEVLPGYSLPSHEVLIIVMDADLYSSTIYVLRHLRTYIRPGTYIYFDEMNHVDHEPKAFNEFMKGSSLKFRPVTADKSLDHAVFECYEDGS
jgi:hypothetical protein